MEFKINLPCSLIEILYKFKLDSILNFQKMNKVSFVNFPQISEN